MRAMHFAHLCAGIHIVVCSCVSTELRATPLIDAIEEGDIAKVRRLVISQRVQTFDRAADGTPALSYSIRRYRFEIANTLIESGADPNSPDSLGRPPLFYAVKARAKAVVESLLLKKANVRARDNRGYTVLMTESSFAIVQLLLKAGAEPTQTAFDGNTPLLVFAGRDVDIVKLLIARGAPVNAQDQFGYSALMVAASSGQTEIVKVLIDAGAEINQKNRGGETALLLAVHCGQWEAHGDVEGHIATIKLLLRARADVNAKAADGTSTLAACRRPEVQDLLRAAGAR